MKNSIITEAQIVKAIKEYDGGRELNDICRELGIHKSTFYNWRKKYAGMDSQVSLLSQNKNWSMNS